MSSTDTCSSIPSLSGIRVSTDLLLRCIGLTISRPLANNFKLYVVGSNFESRTDGYLGISERQPGTWRLLEHALAFVEAKRRIAPITESSRSQATRPRVNLLRVGKALDPKRYALRVLSPTRCLDSH